MALAMTREPEVHRVTLPRAPFPLALGESLPSVDVAFRTWGAYDPAASDGRGNAILVCHALTGDADVSQWWPGVVGEGRALDPGRYFIIGSNILGGCRGTTGPLSPDPRTGRPYGLEFPTVTVQDMVAAQAALLDALGVEKILLVTGGSLGGMQALAWALLHPERIGSAFVAAAPWASPPLAIAWNEIGRQAILTDPHFSETASTDEGPSRGLAVARMLAMTTYRSGRDFEGRFGRSGIPKGLDPTYQRAGAYRTQAPPGFRFRPAFQIESYLHYQGEKLVRRFDALSYLYLTRAMDLFDGSELQGPHPAGGLPPVRSLAVDSDLLYPPKDVDAIRKHLAHLGYPASHVRIGSPYGHDGFLLEGEAMSREISSFLDEVLSGA